MVPALLATAVVLLVARSGLAEPAWSTPSSQGGSEPAGTGDSQRRADALSWTAPPGCVSEAELRQRVWASARPELVPAGRRLVGTMEQKTSGLLATFAVVEGGELLGRRVLELSFERCAEATESLELVAAMLLEGGLSQAEREAHQAEQAGAAPVHPKAPSQPVGPPEKPEGEASERGAPPRRQRWTVRAGAALTILGEAAPDVQGGAAVEFGVRSRWPIWIVATGLYVPRTFSALSPWAAQLGLREAAFGLLACAGPTRWKIDWQGCTGWAHWIQSAETQGVIPGNSSTWDRSSLAFAARAAGPIAGPLGWQFGGRLDVLFQQVRYTVDSPQGSEEVFSTGPVFPSAQLGLVLTF